MSRPFHSSQTYVWIAIVGILLICIFLVALVVSQIQEQTIVVASKNDGGAAKLQEPTQSPQRQKAIWLPTAILVTAYVLIGYYVATGSSMWILLLGGSLLALTLSYNRYTYGSQPWREYMRPIMKVIAAALFLWASMTLVNVSLVSRAYSKQYDYKGTANVVGMDSYVGTDGTYNSYYFPDATCPIQEYITILHLSWDCPEDNSCSTITNGYICDEAVCFAETSDCALNCTDSELETAQQESNECQSRHFNESMATLQGDNDDLMWSSIQIYGNCTSCRAEWRFIVDTDRRNRNALGFGDAIFLYLAGIGASICVVVLGLATSSSCCKTDDDEEERHENLLATTVGDELNKVQP